MNLLRIAEIDVAFEDGDFPLRASTMYAWHHAKKHAEIFIKLGGALFVDLDAFDSLLESGRGRGKKGKRRKRTGGDSVYVKSLKPLSC
jgi:hypothetical protein